MRSFQTAHGGGTEKREPLQAHARYAINATASSILFIADMAGEG